MSEKLKKLSDVDLSRVQNQKNKVNFATTLAEKAIADAKNAELEYINTVQKIYLENRLDVQCKIDEQGNISWPAEEKPTKKAVKKAVKKEKPLEGEVHES